MSHKKAKYLQLLSWIESKIENGDFKSKDRFYSENQLAKMFGYSRQTIRHALKILEDRGSIQRIRGSGTFVVETIKPRTLSNKIGLISTYQESYIFPSIIKGVESITSDAGFSLQISLTNNKPENESRGLLSMIDQGVDGIIVEPTKSGLPNPNERLYKRIRSLKIPLIFFNAYYPGMDFPHVSMDDFLVGQMATRHLIDKGHRKIGGIFLGDDRQGHLRYAGYIDTLNKNDIPANSKNIVWLTTEDIPYFKEDFSRVLRNIKGCTAVFCYNDQIANLLIEQLKENGINVPEDISVIGVDNSQHTSISGVAITSIAHPMEELGETVAKKVLELLKNPEIDATVNFKPKLIEGKSVLDRRKF